jgi:hypothetical protein
VQQTTTILVESGSNLGIRTSWNQAKTTDFATTTGYAEAQTEACQLMPAAEGKHSMCCNLLLST